MGSKDVIEESTFVNLSVSTTGRSATVDATLEGGYKSSLVQNKDYQMY